MGGYEVPKVTKSKAKVGRNGQIRINNKIGRVAQSTDGTYREPN